MTNLIRFVLAQLYDTWLHLSRSWIKTMISWLIESGIIEPKTKKTAPTMGLFRLRSDTPELKMSTTSAFVVFF